jgi:hypothetical protein
MTTAFREAQLRMPTERFAPVSTIDSLGTKYASAGIPARE